MGQHIAAAVLAVVAVSLIGLVVFHQMANRRAVGEMIELIRTEVTAAFPDDEGREWARDVVTRYMDSATGFERTVSRAELFLSRQAFLRAIEDGKMEREEAVELVRQMESQMERGESTFHAPAGEP